MSAVRYRKKTRTCMGLSASSGRVLYQQERQSGSAVYLLTRLSLALSTISLTRRRGRRWNAPASRTTRYSFTATRVAGKTHLIQAIGNHFKKQYPGRKVFYLTSENSLSIIPTRCRKGPRTALKISIVNMTFSLWTMYNFFLKRKGPRRTLPPLQHTSRYEQTNCFSSDRAPVAIPDIAERLKGRLASGMAVDIGEPDPESRMAIVRKKAGSHGVMLSDEVIEYVATTMSGSIRELEGMVNNIVCHAQVKGFAPDIAEVRQSLRSFTRPQKTFRLKMSSIKLPHFTVLTKKVSMKKQGGGRWCVHGKLLCIFFVRISVFRIRLLGRSLVAATHDGYPLL